MTRINLIPPSELHSKHLVAEYRELPRIAALAEARAEKPGTCIGKVYTLGKGHMMFFIDKGEWLQNRFNALVKEMHSRGYTTNYTSYPIEKHPIPWRKNWEPTKFEIAINKLRIMERMPV